MDNMSKAFIITGAILVALAVATVTIIVFNNAESGFEQEQNDSNNRSIAIFNSQYEAYFGKNRSREQAAKVCSLAENNNKKSDPPTYISCPSSQSFIDASPTSLYTISGSYDSGTGYISAIIIN